MQPISIKANPIPDISELPTIVYSTIKHEHSQIVSVNNGQADPLIDNGRLNFHPVVDPTGQYMIYTSEVDGSSALYVKNLKQPHQMPRRLLEGDFMQDKASISPDGHTVYFVASRDNGTDIYSLPFNPNRTANTLEAVNMTKGLGGFSPAISPCGQWIAFSSNRHSQSPFPSGPILPDNYKSANVYLMKIDGSHLMRIYESNDWQGAPTWSKDGSKLYFYTTVEGKQRLHCCNSNTMQVQLVKGFEYREVLSSALMPNGRLAFIEKDGAHRFIASVDLKKPDLDYRRECQSDITDLAIGPDGTIYGSSLKNPTEIFGEGPPSATKHPGQGPFFDYKKEVTLTTGEKVNLLAVRGYFPTLTAKRDKIVAYEDFDKIYSFSLGKSGSKKHIWSAPHGNMGLGLSVSPDGNQVITAVGPVFNNTAPKHIYRIDLKTGKEENLTENSTANDSFPAYTPNGDILFASSRGTKEPGQKNLYLMDMKDHQKKLTRLTFTQGVDSMPAMSAQGDKIVYISKRGQETHMTFNLFMLTLDKVSGIWKETHLYKSKDAFAHPRFSPDGNKIVCSTGLYGLSEETPLVPVEEPQAAGEIVVIDIPTKQIQRLTANMWENSLPHWA